jgi:hypothetical protein
MKKPNSKITFCRARNDFFLDGLYFDDEISSGESNTIAKLTSEYSVNFSIIVFP